MAEPIKEGTMPALEWNGEEHDGVPVFRFKSGTTGHRVTLAQRMVLNSGQTAIFDYGNGILVLCKPMPDGMLVEQVENHG